MRADINYFQIDFLQKKLQFFLEKKFEEYFAFEKIKSYQISFFSFLILSVMCVTYETINDNALEV